AVLFVRISQSCIRLTTANSHSLARGYTDPRKALVHSQRHSTSSIPEGKHPMAGVRDYSTTAASNLTVGGIGIQEGMARSSVNNAMRATVADTANLLLDLGGAVTTSGTGTT